MNSDKKHFRQTVSKILTLAALLISMGTAASEEAVDTWPSPNWQSAQPAEVALEEEKLNEAREYALSAGGSGMIVRHGKAVLRWEISASAMTSNRRRLARSRGPGNYMTV